MSAWESVGQSDEWYTPKYIFDALGVQFNMDVAAPKDRTFCVVPAHKYITENSLNEEWNGFVWCNPPFGGRNEIRKWIEKMTTHKNGIILTPDRTSTEWWQFAAAKSDSILFVKSKIKFVKPDGSIGKSPSTGTTLFAFGSNGVMALHNAALNGLGINLE